MIINTKISYDLILTQLKNREEGSVSLISLFLSLVMMGLWTLVVGFLIEIPWYMKVWLVAILVQASFGTYKLLRDLQK